VLVASTHPVGLNPMRVHRQPYLYHPPLGSTSSARPIVGRTNTGHHC
jgi:hypothetical protein